MTFIPDTPCQILNYIWINGGNKPLPDSHLQRAYANAARNPHAEVQIWQNDSSTPTGPAPQNAVFYDLNAIPGYRQNGIFESEKISIPVKADLARLLVLKHCLDFTQAAQAFYSDFDVPHIDLKTPRMQLVMSAYGMTYGRTLEGVPENSFLGFARGSGQHFLERHLIPATRRDAARNHNGYMAFRTMTRMWGNRVHHDYMMLSRVACQPVPLMGTPFLSIGDADYAAMKPV